MDFAKKTGTLGDMTSPFHGDDASSNLAGDATKTRPSGAPRNKYVAETRPPRHQAWFTAERGGRSRARPEYIVWRGMLSRCTNPGDADWPDYGGRGITVCERWSGEDGWHCFFEDMGARPTPKHTIDRVDNSRGYSPDNCRWATMKEQARNRRGNRLVTVNGKTLCASAWAEMFGIQRQRFIKRLDAGWDPGVALATPVGVPKGAAHEAAEVPPVRETRFGPEPKPKPPRKPSGRRCSRCRQPGHYATTCSSEPSTPSLGSKRAPGSAPQNPAKCATFDGPAGSKGDVE